MIIQFDNRFLLQRVQGGRERPNFRTIQTSLIFLILNLNDAYLFVSSARCLGILFSKFYGGIIDLSDILKTFLLHLL